MRYTLSRPQNDFSVLRWNSCRFGSCCDQQFHGYFEWVAREKPGRAEQTEELVILAREAFGWPAAR